MATEGLRDSVTQGLPNFVKARDNLRRDGAIAWSQLVNPSNEFYVHSNAGRQVWQHLINRLLKVSPHKKNALTSLVSEIYDVEDLNRTFATLEGMIGNLEDFSVLILKSLVDDYSSDNDAYQALVRSLRYYVQCISGYRILSNHVRHCNEPDYSIDEGKRQTILSLLNNVEFKAITLDCSVAMLAILRMLEGQPLTLDFIREKKKEIDDLGNSEVPSTMDVYRERLNELIWGPKQYTRSEQLIKDAHNQLRKSNILCLYGIGGVGKTALAQKLMYDVINNDEPYTHIVTFSSKVGSDQKTINTISESLEGGVVDLKIETDDSVTVMDTSLIQFNDEIIIGGLHFFLKKVYSEVTASSKIPDLDTEHLRKKVLELLSKKDHRILIVLDNFEDIEDNVDDSTVKKMRTDFKEFLESFSKIDTESRVIVTTRSSPMDVAVGIQIHPLNREEAARLFATKLRFRSQRAATPRPVLSERLANAHRLVSSTDGEFSRVLEAFDVWEQNGDHIAHPLLVLLAAEEVDSDDIDTIAETIKEWGLGSRGKEVMEYCVSKTLGSFTKSEQNVIKLLIHTGDYSSNITAKYIDMKLEDIKSETNSLPWITEGVLSEFRQFSTDEITTMWFKLIDRSFLTESGTTNKTSWNAIVYNHLNHRFYDEQPQSFSLALEQADGTPPMEGVEALYEWVQMRKKLRSDANLQPLTFKDVVDPLGQVSKALVDDLEARSVNRSPSFSLTSTIHRLDQHSVVLNEFFKLACDSMVSDPKLSSWFGPATPRDKCFDRLLNVACTHIESWMKIIELHSGVERVVYIGAAISCQEALREALRTLRSSITPQDYLSLLLRVGLELEDIGKFAKTQTTQQERIALLQLGWLNHVGDLFKPWECSLREANQLHFSPDEVKVFSTWVDLYEELVSDEQGAVKDRVDGLAFWAFLRLFSTNKHYQQRFELKKLDWLKDSGYRLHPNPAIVQYIRVVQESYNEPVHEFEDYVRSFQAYKSQPINGTLLVCKVGFISEYKRWEQRSNDTDWLVVIDSDKISDKGFFEKAIVKQTAYSGTDKRISAEFLRGSDGEVLTDLTDNMTASQALKDAASTKIKKLIAATEKQGLNSISFLTLLKELSKIVPANDKDKIREYSKQSGLIEYSSYFVIDPDGSTDPPPAAYTQMHGSENISDRYDRAKIQLPREPQFLSEVLVQLYDFKKEGKEFTLKNYADAVKKKWPSEYSKASNVPFYLYFSLGDSKLLYKKEWKSHKFKHSDIHPWAKLKQRLLAYLYRSTEILHEKYGIRISKSVLDAYFDEVGDPSQLD
jgi:GTPase SAR1 family protein